MIRKLFPIFLFITICIQTSAQEFLGSTVSNYAGVMALHHQPAAIVDSRIAFDLNLIGVNVGFGNNYVGFDTRELRRNTQFRGGIEFLDTSGSFLDKYVTQLKNERTKTFFFNTTIYGPSFMVSLKNKHSFAVTTTLRNYFNINDFSAPFADQIWEASIDGSKALNDVVLEGDGFNLQMASWSEIGLTYGTVLWGEKEHELKGAVRVKRVQGLGAMYFYADDLNFSIPNDSTVNFDNATFSYGHSANLDRAINGEGYSSFGDFLEGSIPTFGFDIGFEYEYRPKYKDYYYFMNNDSNNIRHDLNKYKYKLGISLTDVGKIKFDKGVLSHNFSVSSQEFELGVFSGVSNVEEYDSVITSELQRTSPPDILEYSLPTELSLQFDYNIKNNFYVNISAGYAFKPKRLGARELSRLAVVPRYEQHNFEAAVPISYDGNGRFNLGAHLKLWFLTVGSNNILGAWFLRGYQTGFNVYAGVKLSLHKNMLKDKDNDFVSNKFDDCKREPGTWERQGCPEPVEEEPADRDGDSVIDDEDLCPDDSGMVVFNGCPDTDGDSIPDIRDSCAQEFGLLIFNGCPDTDMDSVPDVNDSCPDIPGLIELKGCPETEDTSSSNDTDSSNNTSNVSEQDSGASAEKEVDNTANEKVVADTKQPEKDCFEEMSDEEAYAAAVSEYGDKNVEGLSFKVQIGAFGSPPPKSYFNFLEGVGAVEKLNENGLTKFRVGDYGTIAKAEKLRRSVKDQGIRDAFVTPLFNGKKISLRDAIKKMCND